MQVWRVTFRRQETGKRTRTRNMVLKERGNIRVGDIATIEGEEWEITKIKPTTAYMEFSTEQGKLKQVFP